MKAISVLGTSSNAGKSWVSTALCAWLRRQGVKVAPFKAQNMANNAFATWDGGEIGTAQAVQAEACGLQPQVEMNPILLKPNGPDGSQIVRLGKAGETIAARNYYQSIEASWEIVRQTLDGWRDRCEALVMEGAGSPVELNLMQRDIVNLRPIEYVGGKWILTANIEFGGVFAQTIGTWQLLPKQMQARGLGFLVNRFRGDLSLFDEAGEAFEKRLALPYLGVMPFDGSLRIDDEDSLNAVSERPKSGSPYIAWIKYPRVSNSHDIGPWKEDEGIDAVWTDEKDDLSDARAIVLPGSKNTLEDLRWLKATGLFAAIRERAAKGLPVVGICGGFQMLGEALLDPVWGEEESGLGLLMLRTVFQTEKRVERRIARFANEEWETYEIHTGMTIPSRDSVDTEPLIKTKPLAGGSFEPEGIRCGSVWGSYQHGLFDSPAMRERLVAELAGVEAGICQRNWRERRLGVYDAMADALERHIDLRPIQRYLGL
ncbi:cobyric acid synthase [Pelagicoccus sp. SDUM812003]|uniref:cobyric acid synthase n=1 Tax=Pelagicoccus sp. SDUM812003 TaxID=3041267 RepID=UPI00280CEB25|nr:cobyric acid synthase [Pelagicoccus sp. SDUM812003]MDQ8203133.1 cobyric acid synthase [Pelagicoccus sp. SDUM812003]